MKLYAVVCDNLKDDTEVKVFDEPALAIKSCWVFLNDNTGAYDKVMTTDEEGYLFYAFWENKGGYVFAKEVTLNE